MSTARRLQGLVGPLAASLCITLMAAEVRAQIEGTNRPVSFGLQVDSDRGSEWFDGRQVPLALHGGSCIRMVSSMTTGTDQFRESESKVVISPLEMGIPIGAASGLDGALADRQQGATPGGIRVGVLPILEDEKLGPGLVYSACTLVRFGFPDLQAPAETWVERWILQPQAVGSLVESSPTGLLLDGSRTSATAPTQDADVPETSEPMDLRLVKPLSLEELKQRLGRSVMRRGITIATEEEMANGFQVSIGGYDVARPLQLTLGDLVLDDGSEAASMAPGLIELRMPIEDGDPVDLEKWFSEDARHDLVVDLMDRSGSLVRRYRFNNCRAMEFQALAIDGGSRLSGEVPLGARILLQPSSFRLES